MSMDKTRVDAPESTKPSETGLALRAAAKPAEQGVLAPSNILPATAESALELRLRESNTQLFFSRYAEDGRLRLFKKGSMLSDDTAGYADQEVVVKVLVKRPSETYMVCIPIMRHRLDEPHAEERLAWAAYEYRN